MKQDVNNQASAVQADSIGTINNYGTTPAPVNGILKNLTLLPAKNPNFVGRETELKQIADDLANDSMVYIVNGIGGIGKSELAYKYLLENEEKYQHIALFEFSDTADTLEDILISALKQSLFLDDNITLDRILYRLQQLQEKCLLVFDNLKNTDDIEKLSCLNNNCDVLITTRLNIPAHKCLNLEILPPDDARSLFHKHYPTDENIDDILEYIDYHSLFIELIAKTLQEGCLSLEELRQKFQSGEFAKIDRSFEQSFNDFLTQRFQIEDDEELKKQLQLLALLPSIEIKLTTLEEIFNNHNRLKPKLSELAKRGWLIKKEGNYKLHQIIKEFILANHSVSFDTASPFMQSISKQLDPDDAYLNPNKKTYFIEIIESILEQFSTEKSAIIATLLDSLCNLYFALGQYNKAQKLQQISLTTKKEILGKKHPDTAQSYNYLANIYDAQGKYTETLKLHEKALAINLEALGKKHRNTSSTYSGIAGVYERQGNYPKALELFQKALAIREDVLGKKHPSTAASYSNIAGVYERQGNYPKALELFQKALAIREDVLGKKHPSTAASYSNIAGVYESQGSYLKALELFQKVLTIEEEVLGKKHPSTATSYNNIALVYTNQGNYPKALKLYQKALAIKEEVLGKNHPSTAASYNNIAGVYESQGNYPKALELFQKALAIQEEVLGKKHPSTATSYNNIAGVYESQGIYPKALELHQKALAIREEVLGEKHPNTATSYHNIAHLYLKQKYCSKALKLASKALSIYQIHKLDNEILGTQELLKRIKHNIKKAKKMPLKRRVKICKDKNL